ncbi:MAG TPA: CPBP family intramembrane glutamic endopeptidase [Candidatus Acidoferrum sp.]|nr:CPBP family intramembrane glutamic endopeptidase [Candidatus Acidoferrum sp.]
MSGERLGGSEKRALLMWVMLGIAGALFAHRYFFRAFPEASVDFRVSRDEALSRAQRFVGGLGEDVSSYQSAIIFDVDDNAKTYLERELGLQQANRMMSSELNIWYWDVRLFKPQQEEEFHVRVSPAGEIAGYNHKVEESRAGATLDRTAAQTAAQNFLSGKLGIDLRIWDFLPEEVNSNKRPNRLDWSFTWEKHGFRAKDAPYRLQAALQGDRVGSGQVFLQVPEAWERSYQQLRSTNIFYNEVAILPYALLIGAALWFGISLTRRGQTSWGGAIKLGIVVAVLLFFMQLNEWPLARASYNTNSSYGTFIFEQIAKAVLFGLGSALTISLILPGAEPLYRASQPGRLRLGEVFTPRGLRSKEFFSSAVVGLSMASAHIGFIVAFYMIASHFGAWAPQELNYENSINTAFPWIAGVAIGLLASTSEEFLFRLFAIPFLQRVTRSRIVAVILPAFAWSFLHSAYPNEPPYIRGIEVGLIGIVAGIVMLRWGILATLIWHYTVDASLVGLLLVRSNSLYFKISGVIVAAAALAPLAFSAISYLARGGFEAGEDLLNRAEPVPDISLAGAESSSKAAATARRYDGLTTGTIGFLVVCFIVGGALAWRLKQPALGDYLKLSVDARTARARADEILRRRGLDPASYHHAAVLANTTDPVANEFLRQGGGIARLNEIYATQVPGVLWRVRYFRDSQPEEYAVILKTDGSLHSIHHTLAEAAPGSSLTKEEAQARAEKFLRVEKKIDLNQWRLVEANSDKRPHRTDHSLTWQQNVPLDSTTDSAPNSKGHAYARLDLSILGEEVANYRTYIKIPDDWRRKQEELTLPRVILGYAFHILFYSGLGLAALILFLKNLRSEAVRSIPWKRLGSWSIWGLLAYILVFFLGNRIPNFLSFYNTVIPYKTLLGGIGVGFILGAALYFSGLALLFGTAWYYASRAFGDERIPHWTSMPPAYYRDGFWIGLGGGAALLALRRLLEVASAYWPTLHRAAEVSFDQNFDAILPAASILGDTLLRSLYYTGIVALLASFIAAQLRPRWLRFSLLLLGALSLTGGDWGNPADLAKQFLAKAILLAVMIFGIRRIMRFNILGCFLVLAGTSLLAGVSELLRQPDAFYRANGYAVLLALLLLLAWPLSAWRMRTTSDT